MPDLAFSQLNLAPNQLSNLEQLGYAQMTPIQAAALPPALAGRDLIAQAKTGSGKTAAFTLAILAKLDPAASDTQALVLCPTRELSLQVTREIRRLARHIPNVNVTTIYGGQAIRLQAKSLQNGTQIVVGTPGRLKDLLEREILNVASVHTLVFDEADRMLEMGFIEDLDFIVETIPSDRQTLLYSATYPENIQSLSQRFQRNPLRVSVDTQVDAPDIRQVFYACDHADKLEALRTLLLRENPESALIFCNQKETTREVNEELSAQGFSAQALNGDLEQRTREEVLTQFAHQSCTLLVATDVAARGLDIKALPLVINFDLPHDPETYIHRIGRTGRAGEQGVALSLFQSRESNRVQAIAEAQGLEEMTTDDIHSLGVPDNHMISPPPNVTLLILGGRKAKIRPGDILGALTGDGGIAGSDVGKIDVMDFVSFVAIRRAAAKSAEQKLRSSKIKGKSYRTKRL